MPHFLYDLARLSAFTAHGFHVVIKSQGYTRKNWIAYSAENRPEKAEDVQKKRKT